MFSEVPIAKTNLIYSFILGVNKTTPETFGGKGKVHENIAVHTF